MLNYILILMLFLVGVFNAHGNERSLDEMRKELTLFPIWYYPYPEIILDMEAKQESAIQIFTYGSLMDIASARRTLSLESLATRRPAVAYDLKRVFDRDVAVLPNSKFGIPADPNARGMLNVWPSDKPGEIINGVLINVSLEDVPNVLLREVGYNLIPVIVQEWGDFSSFSPAYKIAYTFQAPSNSSFTNKDISPRPGYYEMTRDAASQFGGIFEAMWIRTTYMADGITPISSWENRVQKGDPYTKALFLE